MAYDLYRLAHLIARKIGLIAPLAQATRRTLAATEAPRMQFRALADITRVCFDAHQFNQFVAAERILKPGGTFIAKVFQGGAERALLTELKRGFAELRHVKPPASRAQSAETYVVAKGFRGREQVIR